MNDYCKTCGVSIPGGIERCLTCAATGVKEQFEIYHIRTHVAGFTLKDQPIYTYKCPKSGTINKTRVSRTCLCGAALIDQCNHESCEHHASVSYCVLITDSNGQEIGELCESENQAQAEEKVNNLNSLAADPETKFKVGQRKGRKKQEQPVTGRMSSRGLNLQNVSYRPEDGSLSRGIDWGKVDNSAYAELPISNKKP